MEQSGLVSEMSARVLFKIPYLNIPITDIVFIMWIIMIFIVVTAYIFTKSLKNVPDKKQNIAEIFVDFVNNLCKENIGKHHWRPFAPYLGSVLLFLIFSNTISIFNFIPGFELSPPTRNINTTACLAIMSIVLVLFSGIKVKGFGGWLKSLAEPMPIIAPFKILDYFIRPLSLALRLFGNILGAFIVMALVYKVFPLNVVIPGFLSVYFDLFDGILQAYIFVFLTSLYLAEAIE